MILSLSLCVSLCLCLSPPSELIAGTPSLKINHGSGTLVLQLTNNIGVADRRWHRLDVRSNNKVSDALTCSFSSCMRKMSDLDKWCDLLREPGCTISTCPHSVQQRWPFFTLSPQFKGSALHPRSMFQRDYHGDGRRGLMGDDRGPFVLWNPRSHTQQGQVRSIIRWNRSHRLCRV